ncbi:MAG TPA: alpha/beta hydrolase [Thermomicrobiales bacterium]
MATSIYRSRAGERAILARYDAAVAVLPVAADNRMVETHVGPTHLLVAGPVTAPPLIVLSGGNFLSPTCLGWFIPLAAEYRLYAPDIVGQPGLSAPTRPSPRGDDHARWLADILDALGLGRVPLVGISYGAGLALRLTGYAPDRVAALALVSPAGLVTGPIAPMLSQIIIPMLTYRFAPNPQRLVRATSPLLSEPDEALSAQIGDSYRHVRLDTGLPRRATAEGLERSTAPVLVFAGANDPFFPGAAVATAARAVIPHHTETVVLADSRHIPSRATFATINARILAFLAQTCTS